MLRFRYFQPLNPAKTRVGSSLLELLVYISILGVILVSLMRLRDQVDDSKLASIAETARRINDAAAVVYASTGAWPADVWNSIMPPEIEPYMSKNIFTNDTPLGGRWDWNGPGSGVGSCIGIALRFDPAGSVNTQVLSKLDALIDDGNPNTGECKGVISSGRYFYIMKVATN